MSTKRKTIKMEIDREDLIIIYAKLSRQKSYYFQSAELTEWQSQDFEDVTRIINYLESTLFPKSAKKS